MAVEEITATELKKKMDADEDVQIIDVREQKEYDFARIPTAKLIPIGEIIKRIGEIDSSREAVLHCHAGGRSKRAIEELQRAGFAGKLKNLKGGITAWSDEVDRSVPKY